MTVAIIKYNAGNVQSVQYALERIGVSSMITDDHEAIRKADKVVFPGVGHAQSAMQHLKKQGLDQLIPSLRQPVLGICLGLQLMCNHSEEGDTACLGIFDHTVQLFPAGSLKVPQIGWNNLTNTSGILFNQLTESPFVYAVHSYYASLGTHTAAQMEYGLPFSAALQKDNFYAVQFHPEKSGKVGETILNNFIQLP